MSRDDAVRAAATAIRRYVFPDDATYVASVAVDAAAPHLIPEIAQEALIGALHPEFGTEWREPDGVIWKAIHAVEVERDEALAQSERDLADALIYKARWNEALAEVERLREQNDGLYQATLMLNARAERAEAAIARVEALCEERDAKSHLRSAFIASVDIRAALRDDA